MSLLRLLKAGRSLWGGNNSGLHYRMTSPKAMPKFGSAKNPFRSKASAEPKADEAPQVISGLQPVTVEQEPEKPAPLQPAAALRRTWKALDWLTGWGPKLWARFS